MRNEKWSTACLNWYEDASPTHISRAYLTVIDDSTRDVADKISKTEYIIDQMYLSDNRSVPSISAGDYGCLHDIPIQQ
jgi:hypothetical protein